jgi:phosphomannomutase
VEEISKILYNDQLNQYFQKNLSHPKLTNKLNAANDYIKDLTNQFDFKRIKRNNNLKVVLDTGAGAGKIATPKILRKLGCKIKLINNEFKKNKFPREIEPIEKNLKDIIQILVKEKCDLGFAQDCDADRIAIIGNDGTCYPEDIGLALIADYYFKQYHQEGKRIIFVTNLASSLIFEAIASKYDAQVIRTPVGERNLADKMEELILKEGSPSKIFGGEGSCGGVMIPQFNNTRDGIFAVAKIVEILVEAKDKISNLVSKLPKFYSFREYISIKNINLEKIITQLKESLTSEGRNLVQIGMDLRFSQENDWFVLIHPSNTEPIIRIISEAKSESLAISNLNNTVKQIKLIMS